MSAKNYRSRGKASVLLNLLSDPAVILDGKGNFLIVNDAFEEVTGLSRKELIGNPFFKLNIVKADSKAVLLENLKKRMQGAPIEPYEVCFTSKAGENRCVEVKGKKGSYAGQPANLVVFHDVTRRKENARLLKEYSERMEALVVEKVKEIQDSEEKFRAISTCAKDAIVAVDSAGEITYWNPAAEGIFGYTEKEVIGKKVNATLVPPRFRKNHFRLTAELAKKAENKNGAGEIHEFPALRKDGTEFSMELSVAPLQLNGKLCFVVIARDVTHRKALENKLSNYSKHLKSMVELRTAQLKDANERLVKSERLAAIGELAGMVGHDMRNPLTAIKNAAYYLEKKGTKCPPVDAENMFEVIDKSIDHANKIINDLLDYSRELHLELTDCAPRTLLNETLKLVQVPGRIQIINYVHDEPRIRADADKLMRVFFNLIKNAIDAMPERGTLEIASHPTGDNIEITFADTGVGISKETLPKIFSPLFTTKAQGMGFGLAICKRIIELHGGTITVKTAQNKGTTFKITLPINDNKETNGENAWINMPESLMSTTTKT